jgi:hypothetical protein
VCLRIEADIKVSRPGRVAECDHLVGTERAMLAGCVALHADLPSIKNYPAAGMVSAPSCGAEDVYAGQPIGLGFWPFFDANCASRFFCSLSG